MTPELAAENAAKILDQANEHPFDAHEAAALVNIADGWTRLHTALAHAPKPIESGPDVIKLSNDANRPSVIRLRGTDYEIHGCAFRELGVGRDDAHATVELKLVKKF